MTLDRLCVLRANRPSRDQFRQLGSKPAKRPSICGSGHAGIQPEPPGARKKIPALTFSAAGRDKKDPADQANSAHHGWHCNAVILVVLDFERTDLRVFLLCCPPESAVREPDDAYNDENDANDSSGFHC